MGRTSEFKGGSDVRWQVHYNNSAEELYPDAFHPATGHPVRTLTEAEDKRVIKHADAAYENERAHG